MGSYGFGYPVRVTYMDGNPSYQSSWTSQIAYGWIDR